MNNKLEMTFKVEHADLYRNEQNELIVHLVGVDEAELVESMKKFHEVMEANKQGQEPSPELPQQKTE